MSWTQMLYKRLLQLGKVSAPIAFLLAAPYSAWEYRKSVVLDRAKTTLSFYDQYNKFPITDYRASITKIISENAGAIASASAEEELLDNLTLMMVKDGNIEKDLLLIFDFFEGLNSCVDIDACDERTTKELFSNQARMMFTIFYAYIQKARKAAGNRFGFGIEHISKL